MFLDTSYTHPLTSFHLIISHLISSHRFGPFLVPAALSDITPWPEKDCQVTQSLLLSLSYHIISLSLKPNHDSRTQLSSIHITTAQSICAHPYHCSFTVFLCMFSYCCLTNLSLLFSYVCFLRPLSHCISRGLCHTLPQQRKPQQPQPSPPQQQQQQQQQSTRQANFDNNHKTSGSVPPSKCYRSISSEPCFHRR